MKSLSERYEELVADATENRPVVMLGPQPTDTHRECIGLMMSILDMAEHVNAQAVPAPLRALARTLRNIEETLAVEFATVPQEAIVGFMRELSEKIVRITGDRLVRPGAEAPAAAAPGPELARANGRH